MAFEDTGHRCADGAYEWTRSRDGSEPLLIRHFAPDATSHLYPPGGIDERILLYCGQFQVGEPGGRPFDGDIRLSWLPTPSIEACGERSSSPDDMHALLSSINDVGIWYRSPQVLLPATVGVPPVPPGEAPLRSARPGIAYLAPTLVSPQEFGDGTVLSRVTGLIPNGWDGPGRLIADPRDRRHTWYGRATARGGGWVLHMDAVECAERHFEELRRRGGYVATHTASLTRADGAVFTAAEATDALHAVRYALVLALGHRTDVVLPVGWSNDQPVWARWTAGQTDSYGQPGTWLDASIAADQVADVVGRFLDNWPDPLRRDTLVYAASYYAQALAQGVELGTASALSGLSLLAYSWLVEERRIYSRSIWKVMKTEAQIRALLEFSECRVYPGVPGAFANLAAVAQHLNATKPPHDAERDGLDCVVTMRNHVMHPTRDRRKKWSPYQWTEAQMLAAHFLELAMLAYVGYRYQYHPRTSANRWLGYVEDVPWTGC